MLELVDCLRTLHSRFIFLSLRKASLPKNNSLWRYVFGGFFKFSNAWQLPVWMEWCQRVCHCIHLSPELMIQMIPMTMIYVCFNGVYISVGWVFDFVNNLLSPFISKPSKNWWPSWKNQQWTSGLWKDIWWFLFFWEPWLIYQKLLDL